METLKEMPLSDLFILQTQVEKILRQSWCPKREEWEDFQNMIICQIEERTHKIKDSIFKS